MYVYKQRTIYLHIYMWLSKEFTNFKNRLFSHNKETQSPPIRHFLHSIFVVLKEGVHEFLPALYEGNTYEGESNIFEIYQFFQF